MSRYFWDTNLFIYQIEVHPAWWPKVSALVAYQERSRSTKDFASKLILVF